MKLTRVANVSDCYYHLSRELSKDNTRKYQTYINTRSPLIKGKTTWTTDKTFICLGIENRDEYIKLSTNDQNIYHIDRTNIPDIQPVADTQKIYQIHPSINNTNNTTSFVTSFLPCSCPKCCIDPTDTTNCQYRQERNI